MPRQKELKAKLAAEKAAEEKADNLKGQLALEKAKAQQAEAEKNSKLQWVETRNEPLVAYKVATIAFSGEPLLKKPREEKLAGFDL